MLVEVNRSTSDPAIGTVQQSQLVGPLPVQ